MKLKHTSILRAAFAACIFTASAPLGAQVVTTLTPPTPPAGQVPRFGTTTAAGERFTLIADTGDDQRGVNAGAVYVHNAVTGALLRKLTASDGAAGDQFGSSVALSNELAIIGASQDDDRGTDSGSAYVFNLSTGAQLRKLNAVDGVTLDKFGNSATLQGDIGIIGAAASVAERGAAYVFNISNGQQLRKLVANDGVAADRFGASVELSGNAGLIGAPGDDEDAGSCYLFDVSTGAPLRKITANDREAGDGFGGSVSLSSDVALIGAIRDDDLGESAGAAYLFRVSSGTQLRKLHASDGNGSDFFGSSVSVNLNVAVVGALRSGSFRGQAYVFDTVTGVELRRLAPADLPSRSLFGTSVSVYANRVVVGAPQISLTGENKTGLAFIFNDQSVPAPAAVVAQKAGAAPEVVNATFNAFTSHTMNRQGESLLLATLLGAGANDTGLWNRLGSTLDLMVQKGDQIDGPTVRAIQSQVMNNNSFAVTKMQLTGAGVNLGNDVQLLSDNGSQLRPLMRESQAVNGGGFSGQVIKDIKEVAASYTQPQAALFSTFAAPALATADSGIIILDLNTGTVIGGLREGDVAPFTGTTIGVFAERVAFTGSTVIAHVGLVGATPTTNAALLQVRPGQLPVAIARKGDVAPGTGTADIFTAFLAESVSTLDEPVFLASISGPAAVNQGIWTRRVQSNALTLVVQKGSQVPGLAGVTISSFTRFWAQGFGQVMVQARLTGAGVLTGNDEILMLFKDGRRVVLFREGDAAPNCDGARIGGFVKVDADPATSGYAVQTALIGVNPAHTAALANVNQALWLGDARIVLQPVVTPDELLRPALALRKGSLHTLGSLTARLLTLDMTLPADTSAASGRGLGGPVGSSNAALILSYGGNNLFAAQTQQ